VPAERSSTRARAAVARLPIALDSSTARAWIPSGRSILLGLALLGASIGAYVGARESSLFAVQSVDVRGAPPRISREVESSLGGLLGTSLLRLDRTDVERRLAALSDVRGISLDRSFPHTLVVTVRPERPVAVLRQGADAWLVSARGRVIRPVELGTARTLPRIWLGKDATLRLGATVGDAEGSRAVAALGPIAGTGFGPRIRLVRAGEDELTFVLRSGVELRLGDGGDIRLKLAIARRILRAAGASMAAGAYLDVSVPERPVTAVNPQVGG
jgi:cell division protein FtsQ